MKKKAAYPTKPPQAVGSARNIVSGFAELQRGLTGARSLIGASYMDNPAMLDAYLAYYWPVSRSQASHAIATANHFAASVFHTVIDVGSGPGPVAAAFIDASAGSASGGGKTRVVLIDQSRRALELALRELPARCLSPATLSTVPADICAPQSALIPYWGEADCISFGHSLNELFADAVDRIERRADLLEKYATGLAVGGKILIIEPALLSTSRDLLAVRNVLVDRGWRVTAPCCGRAVLPCPALDAGDQHTCHEEISWTMPKETAKLAATMKLDKESLKMTWFMLEPPRAGQGNGGPESGTLARGGELYRVVSDPMLNKAGRVRKLLCGKDGRFPLSAQGESAEAERSGFNRLNRGDYIRVTKPEMRENGWGIGTETIIKREDWHD